MPQAATFRVHGYKELLRACNNADKDTKKYVREAFRQVGQQVRDDAETRFGTVDPRSAAGYRVRVRQRGIAVEQSIRKTTGRRPDYGALQMRRALIPALYENMPATEKAFEQALDRIADRFERSP